MDDVKNSSAEKNYILKRNHCYHTQAQHQMFVTEAPYTDFVVYLRKESSIVHVKRDESCGCDSVPLFETFCDNFIIPEIFVENLLKKHVCKDVLNGIVNKVLQIADSAGIQEKLNQLTKISPPLTMTFATTTKRKIRVAVVTASKKQKNNK